MLLNDNAWSALSLDQRQFLYGLLPTPRSEYNEPPHDVNVNPLLTTYGPTLEAELQKWQQEDLKLGYEGKKWRQDATKAGAERLQGGMNVFKDAEREERWGMKSEEGKENEG
jgi:hypothetical protein